jgi:signal transduction histidine kinase
MQHAEHLLNIGQLASGVAHELKNPLTAILNYADYLLRKYEDQFFEERDRDRLRRIISGVEHIDGFIQDLLVLARPEEDETEGVDLQNVLQESLMYCEATLTRYMANVKVQVEPGLRIAGSRAQLKQVFTNLISNAARALPEQGGPIYLRAHSEGDTVICEVEDGGKGMSGETLERIFEPFYTTRDGDGGTGLGLAIVDNIVRRHQGKIEVLSRLGHGTTFTLRFVRFMDGRSDG